MTVFFRLLGVVEKEAALQTAVADMNAGSPPSFIYLAYAPGFGLIPGSPFAYWVSETLRRKFRELPPFEGSGRTAKQGLATADDFRFVRAWWEVPPERILYVPTKAEELDDPERLRRYQEACREATRRGRYWVPFAKGGEYSPYYADIHLVVNWRDDGMEIRNFAGPNGRIASRPQNTEYYFRPGLTWPQRTIKGFNVRAYQAGCIFAHKGPAAFAPYQQLAPLLALVNSRVFSQFISLHMAVGSYEVGVIQRTPVPNLSGSSVLLLQKLASSCVERKRFLDTAREVARVFRQPELLHVLGDSLSVRYSEWNSIVNGVQAELDERQREVDAIVYDVYGIGDHDQAAMGDSLGRGGDSDPDGDDADGDDETTGASGLSGTAPTDLVAALLSYAVGCAFGRWDVRIGKGEKEPPPLPGPFDPLPPCPPGMLVGPDGLPAREAPPGYPIAIQWDGILVDDPGHPADIVARVREVLGYLFADGDPAAIEEEACRILGVRDLREWFRQEFFPFHIKMYSKSRRKAPVYWQLCSERKSYSVWLYYHCLNHDTLYTVLRSYVEPKIGYEEQRLGEMRERLAAARAQGHRREERDLERQIEAQERLLEELGRFRDRIRAVADTGYAPELDDGVLLSIAPLYQVIPWREAEKAWRELRAGNHPWSSMAKRFERRAP